MPDEESDDVRLVCTECGHYSEEKDQLVGVKDNTLNHRGSAEVLARIHRIKTGHSPVIVE